MSPVTAFSSFALRRLLFSVQTISPFSSISMRMDHSSGNVLNSTPATTATKWPYSSCNEFVFVEVVTFFDVEAASSKCFCNSITRENRNIVVLVLVVVEVAVVVVDADIDDDDDYVGRG